MANDKKAAPPKASGKTASQRSSQRAADLPVALREGESLLIAGRVSNAIFWKAIAVLLIALLAGFVGVYLGYFLCFVSFLMFSYALLLKSVLKLAVTNQRVIFRSGLVKVDTVQVRLDRIESVEIQRTLVGHVLGYGTIVMTGVGSRFSFIPYLANAAEIRNVLDEILYKRERGSASS